MGRLYRNQWTPTLEKWQQRFVELGILFKQGLVNFVDLLIGLTNGVVIHLDETIGNGRDGAFFISVIIPAPISLQGGAKRSGLFCKRRYNRTTKHIDTVWCQDDDMLKGVVQAIKEAGRTEIKTVLGGAGSKDIIKMIMEDNPTVRATVTYNPSMVASGIVFGVEDARGKTVGGLYHTPSRVIIAADLGVKENAKTFYFPESAY